MNQQVEAIQVPSWDQQREQFVRQGYGQVSFARNDMVVHFYNHLELDRPASREAGRPVHKKIVYVRIQEPGQTHTIIEKPATDDLKQTYWRQWDQFSKNQEQVPEGTPIENLFPHDPQIVANLRGWGFHVVEQLARASGHAIDTVGMGMQTWVNQANQYLERAKAGVSHHQFEAQREQYERKIKVLEQNNNDLLRRLDHVEAYIRGNMAGHVVQAMPAPQNPPLPNEFQQGALDPTRRALNPAENQDFKPPHPTSAWNEAPPGFFAEPDVDGQQHMIDNRGSDNPMPKANIRRARRARS